MGCDASFAMRFGAKYIIGKIRFMPPQLREIRFHVQNHATQWHGFQHEIQLQEIVVAWIKMTLFFNMQVVPKKYFISFI